MLLFEDEVRTWAGWKEGTRALLQLPEVFQAGCMV